MYKGKTHGGKRKLVSRTRVVDSKVELYKKQNKNTFLAGVVAMVLAVGFWGMDEEWFVGLQDNLDFWKESWKTDEKTKKEVAAVPEVVLISPEEVKGQESVTANVEQTATVAAQTQESSITENKDLVLLEEVKVDPVLVEIINRLGWSKARKYVLGVNWFNADHSFIYRHGNESLQISGEDSDEARRTIEEILQAHGFIVDGRTERLAASDNAQYIQIDNLWSDGERMFGVIHLSNVTADNLAVADLGKLSSWQAAEQGQDKMLTDPVVSQLYATNDSWKLAVGGATLDWNRNDGEYINTVAFSVKSDYGWEMRNEFQDDEEGYERTKAQVKQTLESIGYHEDQIRTWTYIGCSSGTDATLYTNGDQVYVLGDSGRKYNGDTNNSISHDLWLQYIGPVSLLEEQEDKYKLAAGFIIGTRKNTINSVNRNPYAVDERYLVSYNAHCSENSFVYYKVVDGEAVQLISVMVGDIGVDKCQEWTVDPELNDADKQFLRERFCDHSDDEE